MHFDLVINSLPVFFRLGWRAVPNGMYRGYASRWSQHSRESAGKKMWKMAPFTKTHAKITGAAALTVASFYILKKYGPCVGRRILNKLQNQSNIKTRLTLVPSNKGQRQSEGQQHWTMYSLYKHGNCWRFFFRGYGQSKWVCFFFIQSAFSSEHSCLYTWQPWMVGLYDR